MRSYTVEQVSHILKVNQESVRRWIRSGKLGANISSRKDGNVISERDFDKFLINNPKYIKRCGGAGIEYELVFEIKDLKQEIRNLEKRIADLEKKVDISSHCAMPNDEV